MEFKVGDRVEFYFGNDKCEGVIEKKLPNGNYQIMDGYCVFYETSEKNLTKIEEKKTPFEIKIEELEQRIEKLEKEVFKPVKLHVRPEEPKRSLLTKDERVILRNLDKKWKWIARDKDGYLCVYDKMPQKGKYELWFVTNNYESMNVFKKEIFQFIKWEDKEPYNIEELLKGECGNE